MGDVVYILGRVDSMSCILFPHKQSIQTWGKLVPGVPGDMVALSKLLLIFQLMFYY